MDHGIEIEMGGRTSSIFAPLETLHLRGSAPEGARVELRDGRDRLYRREEVAGEFAADLIVGGALGRQRAALVGQDGEELDRVSFPVDASTGIRAYGTDYGRMWRRLESLIRATRRSYVLHGQTLTCYVTWVRDDVHVMKAAKYWEPQVGQLPEHFLRLQRPDGMIFDYFRPAGFAAERMEVFGPRYYHVDEEEGFRYDRLPVEADVEYLLIEGIYTRWQATGDDAWMARQLPGLERAIEYAMTDPLRWSEGHGLVKRAYTIDTWDFKFFGFDREHLRTGAEVQDAVFNVGPDTPMCIMHGDNSGMYQACRQVGRMHAALGNADRAAHYEGLAEQFRRNTDEHCWNGSYYDHWVPVTPLQLDQGGVDGAKVLSLSNPYDVNRGLPEHEKCVSIIDRYRRLRDELKKTHFAEWLSVHPCWPKGFDGHEAGTYVNGGIIIIVAGELAKAAFQHGRERYGVDILERVNALLQKHWEAGKGGTERGRRFAFPCTYEPSGEVSGGIPDNWAQAAVMSAVMEGLCGLRDEATRFGRARVEPRWIAADVELADVTARYGASDGYVSYRFCHVPASRHVKLAAAGSGDAFDFHVMLPDGVEPTGVYCNGESVPFETSTVEETGYADFHLEGPLCAAIEITYE